MNMKKIEWKRTLWRKLEEKTLQYHLLTCSRFFQQQQRRITSSRMDHSGHNRTLLGISDQRLASLLEKHWGRTLQERTLGRGCFGSQIGEYHLLDNQF